MPYFDRHDIALAWWHYLNDYHEGQFSEKYLRLSRLTDWFTPSHSEEDYLGMGDNAKAIYDDLARKSTSIRCCYCGGCYE